MPSRRFQIGDHVRECVRAHRLVSQAQQMGWVGGDQHGNAVGSRQHAASGSGDDDCPPEQRPRCGRAEGDQQAWLEEAQLFREPPAAVVDLAGIGSLVNTSLTALDEFEMFDRVGEIGASTIDPGLSQCPIEHGAGGAGERPPRMILLITRLLTDDAESCIERPFAEDQPTGMPRKLAGPAALGSNPQVFEIDGRTIDDR